MEKRTSLSRSASFVAESAVLLIAALALSYLESFIPVSFIPLPGFKLGLANIVTVIAFYRISPLSAAAVSALRVVISSMLFSGVSSLMFALSGAVLSFAVLVILSAVFKDKISYIGISVIMAIFHNAGQIVCASLVLKSSAVYAYFPALAASSLICGLITGLLLCALPPRITCRKENFNI